MATSRELLLQQKTLPQNPEELKSKGEKKPFVMKKGGCYSFSQIILSL